MSKPEAPAIDPDINRDWPEDAADENGNYYNTCSTCENLFTGHKYRRTCKVCAQPEAPAKCKACDWELRDGVFTCANPHCPDPMGNRPEAPAKCPQCSQILWGKGDSQLCDNCGWRSWDASKPEATASFEQWKLQKFQLHMPAPMYLRWCEEAYTAGQQSGLEGVLEELLETDSAVCFKKTGVGVTVWAENLLPGFEFQLNKDTSLAAATALLEKFND